MISVYVPNMPNRIERKDSIQRQFENKELFSLNIVRPIKHPLPHVSLWRTFVQIVRKEYDRKSDFFIFCEDDHIFTPNYSEHTLMHNITLAQHLNADLMLGGVSWYDMPIRVSDGLFWVNEFTGMQFTVVYKKFYSRILDSDVQGERTLDMYLSTISDDILVTFPYISIQKEFGYSDVTTNNNTEGRIKELFNHSERKLQIIDKVYSYYIKQNANTPRNE